MRGLAVRIIVVDQVGVAVGEREIVAARGRVLADEARRILIERRVVIDLVEQAEVKMPIREKLELENGPVVVRRRLKNLESVVRIGVDDRVLEKMALRLQADGFEIGKLRAIGREGERAVVERINRVGADAHEAGEIAGHRGRAREVVSWAAGEGAIAIAVVRAGAVRETGVDIVLVNDDVFVRAIETIGVSSMTPTSNVPAGRTNWLFAAS